MEKTGRKISVKKLTNKQLESEKSKLEKLLSSVVLTKVVDEKTEEKVTRNLLTDSNLQQRLDWRNKFVPLAKTVSKISQQFRWNYGETWQMLFEAFYTGGQSRAMFDEKFNAIAQKESGFVNSLSATSLTGLDLFLAFYLEYIKNNRTPYDEQNEEDFQRIKATLGAIRIDPSTTSLRANAIKYANAKLREVGFSSSKIVFEEYFNNKWKKYLIALKKHKTICKEQKKRLTKVEQLEIWN